MAAVVAVDRLAGAREALDADQSCVWALPELRSLVYSRLSANELACLRFINQDAKEDLKSYTAIRVAEPLPGWAFAAFGYCKKLTRSRRAQLALAAARGDSPAGLAAALDAAGISPQHEHLEAAARTGALSNCLWLLEPRPLPCPVDWASVFRATAAGGHLHAIRWCLDRRPELRTFDSLHTAAAAAARGGHVDATLWLLDDAAALAAEIKPAVPKKCAASLRAVVIAAAAYGCDLAFMQRLTDPRAEEHLPTSTLVNALTSPTPDWRAKFEWAQARRWYSQKDLSQALLSVMEEVPAAAALERIRAVKYGDRLSLFMVKACCRAGSLPTLEYVHGERARQWMTAWSGRIAVGYGNFKYVRDAARAGHVAVLRYLKQAGCPLRPEELALAAAAGGQGPVLAWVASAFGPQHLEARVGDVPECRWRRYGSDPDDTVFSLAASAGALRVMRWLVRARGVAMTEAAWSGAAASGCEAAVELLSELGCPEAVDGKPYAKAIELGDWRMLTVLRRFLDFGNPRVLRGVHAARFARAVRGGAPLGTLQWLLAEGWPEVDWARAEAEAEVRVRELRAEGARAEAGRVLGWVRERRAAQEQAGRAKAETAEAARRQEEAQPRRDAVGASGAARAAGTAAVGQGGGKAGTGGQGDLKRGGGCSGFKATPAGSHRHR
ncbi:hypothetical protein HYH03_007829 [Edaphochlamys debaryana]|uniref:Ankyrin repeat domain-containing protein n=1 Tax=Edaphochlamys debaryana TaxID=47281 RepID=A0A835XZI2_9CHLO|nr:hypothetical protein HYH03_007829 [Edaphochlamys debaryana]|eukprot:KAG2493892.1 hypothetical protein HYH03_007829 [Edaphochlamys debaryana]